MRIISQDGTIDVPYELTAIQLVGKTTIVAQGAYFGSNSGDNFATVAEYSTEEKAQKAMEMLREAYFNNKHEETYKDGVFVYSPNFQFPQDTEIEV